MLEEISKEIGDRPALKRFGFPWETVLDVLLQLLAECFPNEQEMLQAAKSPTAIQRAGMRFKVRQQIRDTGRRARLGEADTIADEIFAYCQGCADDKLAAAYTEVAVMFGFQQAEG